MTSRIGKTLVLNIRQEQFDLFAAQQREASELSYLSFFRKTIPESCNQYDDDQLRQLIRSGTAAASEYGIQDGRALSYYLTLCVVISPDFNKNPPTEHLLRMANIDQETKMETLFDTISEQLRMFTT